MTTVEIPVRSRFVEHRPAAARSITITTPDSAGGLQNESPSLQVCFRNGLVWRTRAYSRGPVALSPLALERLKAMEPSTQAAAVADLQQLALECKHGDPAILNRLSVERIGSSQALVEVRTCAPFVRLFNLF